MQDQWYTFNMFDAQAWYVRDIILGRIALPAKADMQQDSAEWRAREEALETDEEMIVIQGGYVKSLIEATDYPSFDIDGVNRTFLEWEHHKHNGIMTFRDKAYRSLMTGNMASVHHTPWLDAMDDSLEAFLTEKTASTEPA